jgi:hypothetical protein
MRRARFDVGPANSTDDISETVHCIDPGEIGRAILTHVSLPTGVRALLVAAGEQEDIRPFFA